MIKEPFLTKKEVEQIANNYPTPFHIYNEDGIRNTARDLKKAFEWNKGFKEYFAVKANPNPKIINILKQEGCGVDCATSVELELVNRFCSITGNDIMFSMQ